MCSEHFTDDEPIVAYLFPKSLPNKKADHKTIVFFLKEKKRYVHEEIHEASPSTTTTFQPEIYVLHRLTEFFSKHKALAVTRPRKIWRLYLHGKKRIFVQLSF